MFLISTQPSKHTHPDVGRSRRHRVPSPVGAVQGELALTPFLPLEHMALLVPSGSRIRKADTCKHSLDQKSRDC